MARTQRSLFAQLNSLAEEISHSSVKAAAVKAAGPTPADPGTYVGSSTHPTATADNGVQTAVEGARSSEYEADIKKQQGPLGVNSTPALSQEGRQDDVQLNIGTTAAATGEDPSSERDYKGTKDDPGTTHPAKTNDGEKYSAVTFKTARAQCGALGNDILANFINFGATKLTKQSEMPAFLKSKIADKTDSCAKDEKVTVPGANKTDSVDLDPSAAGEEKEEGKKEAAFLAGYELAAALGLDKTAAEAHVSEVCANTLREADEMADLFLGYMAAKEAAADPTAEADEGEDHGAPEDSASGASDAPAPEGLAEMMGGAEGAPEMGGEEMMGGPEMGGPEMGGAEGSPDDAVQELAMALEELGIPPEALIQALSQGGAPGGAPAPEADLAAMGGAPKLASDLDAIGRAVINFKRSGKFQVKEARTKRSRELRDMMKQHVIELTSR